MTALRQCNKCKSFLPKTRKHFTPHKPSKDGLLGTCKPCINAKRRAKRLEAKTGLLITVEEAKQLQASRLERRRKEIERIEEKKLNLAINGIKSHSERERNRQQREYENMRVLFEIRDNYRQDRKALKRAIKRVNNKRNTGGWKYIAYDLNKRGYRTDTGDVFTDQSARKYALSFGIKRKWK
jgi:hypothetical protein